MTNIIRFSLDDKLQYYSGELGATIYTGINNVLLF